MKTCDMCSSQTAVDADTYELRFDKLPVLDCEYPERILKWRGELCRKHADVMRITFAAGPLTEGNACSPTADELIAIADILGSARKDGLTGAFGEHWCVSASNAIRRIAKRMRDEATTKPQGESTAEVDAAQLASLAESLLSNPDPEWIKCAAGMLNEIANRMRVEFETTPGKSTANLEASVLESVAKALVASIEELHSAARAIKRIASRMRGEP